MQDKELDSLFRSKLDGFETEPSVNVWQNIDAGLQTGDRRKILAPLLSAAASIVVLVTAGVLLYPRHIKVTADHHKTDIVKSSIPSKVHVADSLVSASRVAQVNTVQKKNPVKQIAVLKAVKKQPVIVQPQVNNTAAAQQTVVNQPAPQVIAGAPEKHDDISQPQKIDTTLLAANSTGKTDMKPVQAVVPDKQIITKTASQPPKKHHIHSLGDMLNTVIAAVDKRKDKLIEFTDTDDDESVITGVNLGIVAVKKQN